MRHVIIGGSAAAISAVEAIRSIDQTSQIDLFSDEKTPLFSRVLLPYYIAEELPKQLLNFRSLDFFEENKVIVHLGMRVQEISPDSKAIKTTDGNHYEFDRLLIATGGVPIIPPIPGIDKQGVSPLKTMVDAERIYNLEGKKAVVIGAGSVGVEASISLRRKGLQVSLLEQLGHVLPTVFDEEASSIIRKSIEERGIEVITGEKATAFKGNSHVTSVSTPMREIECDMVVVAIGIRPDIALVEKTGIEIGSRRGIKVNDYMMTNAAGIYAAGDVAETYDLAQDMVTINAIWPCAVEQGRIAGLNMAGKETSYAGSVRMNSIGNFIGHPAISMGMIRAEAEKPGIEAGEEFQEIRNSTKDTYRKLILKGGRITGAILVGQTQKAGVIGTLLKKKVDVSAYIPVLMSNNLNFMDILPLLRRNADKFREPEYKELMDTGL
jgi:NAD(P)H-nitrite reductase large subunit